MAKLEARLAHHDSTAQSTALAASSAAEAAAQQANTLVESARRQAEQRVQEVTDTLRQTQGMVADASRAREEARQSLERAQERVREECKRRERAEDEAREAKDEARRNRAAQLETQNEQRYSSRSDGGRGGDDTALRAEQDARRQAEKQLQDMGETLAQTMAMLRGANEDMRTARAEGEKGLREAQQRYEAEAERRLAAEADSKMALLRTQEATTELARMEEAMARPRARPSIPRRDAPPLSSSPCSTELVPPDCSTDSTHSAHAFWLLRFAERRGEGVRPAEGGGRPALCAGAGHGGGGHVCGVDGGHHQRAQGRARGS